MTDDKLTFFKQLANQWVSHSPRFEPLVPSQRRCSGDALFLLGSLEKLTRQSIAPVIQAIAQAQARTDAAKERATPAPSAPASRRDQHAHAARPPEYKQALKDPSVVEALLRLQQKAQIQAKKATSYKPETRVASRFQHEAPPRVEGDIKPTPALGRSQRLGHPVLKPRKP